MLAAAPAAALTPVSGSGSVSATDQLQYTVTSVLQAPQCMHFSMAQYDMLAEALLSYVPDSLAERFRHGLVVQAPKRRGSFTVPVPRRPVVSRTESISINLEQHDQEASPPSSGRNHRGSSGRFYGRSGSSGSSRGPTRGPKSSHTTLHAAAAAAPEPPQRAPASGVSWLGELRPACVAFVKFDIGALNSGLGRPSVAPAPAHDDDGGDNGGGGGGGDPAGAASADPARGSGEGAESAANEVSFGVLSELTSATGSVMNGTSGKWNGSFHREGSCGEGDGDDNRDDDASVSSASSGWLAGVVDGGTVVLPDFDVWEAAGGHRGSAFFPPRFSRLYAEETVLSLADSDAGAGGGAGGRRRGGPFAFGGSSSALSGDQSLSAVARRSLASASQAYASKRLLSPGAGGEGDDGGDGGGDSDGGGGKGDGGDASDRKGGGNGGDGGGVVGGIKAANRRESVISGRSTRSRRASLQMTLDEQATRMAAELQRVHTAVATAAKIVKQNKGFVNKVIMDEKGLVLIYAFGAPGNSIEENHFHAVQTAALVEEALAKMSHPVGIGISTGQVCFSLLGLSAVRCEYALLGDTVNLAARLAAHAQHELPGGGGVLACPATVEPLSEAALAQERLLVENVGSIHPKGKTQTLPIYQVRRRKGPATDPTSSLPVRRLQHATASRYVWNAAGQRHANAEGCPLLGRVAEEALAHSLL
ncbi:unnamed protein product, partial [Phaeothamnion confervicola]